MSRPGLYRAAVLLLLLAILGAGITVLALRSQGPGGTLEILLPTPAPAPQALVYVTGAVAREGLYPVAPNARAADAVTAAGGLASDADRARVNLAAFVSDGEHLHVPRLGEAVAPAAQTPASERVNINTASAIELARLPGIGEARAAAIIAERQRTGGFRRVEDLLAIDGIGPATVERLRPLVVVR